MRPGLCLGSVRSLGKVSVGGVGRWGVVSGLKIGRAEKGPGFRNLSM